jgi:photosynthetic reaction center cytochrome c subunit
MSLTAKLGLVFAGLLGAAIVLLTFERPPVVAAQNGFRGTGMQQVVNPRTRAVSLAANRAPAAPEAADADGDKASTIFENVQLLGDLSIGQFGRIMQAMTDWVAPNQGCAYCHNTENMASDEVYTKVVARRMLSMVRTINVDWSSHVAQTGVTCYTCHRGQPVPAETWSTLPMSRPGLSAPTGQNLASDVTAGTSLPRDPFTPYLLGDRNIRVATTGSMPRGNTADVPQAEHTYALMMSMSDALGVNCTFCHNSRAFANWAQSPAPRLTAWHGIRMVRQLNNDYIVPLTPVWAANPRGPADGPHVARLGPGGDALKVNCATCHQGANKPLYGAPMARDFPELALISAAPVTRRAELQTR